jgi:hypothetical protein
MGPSTSTGVPLLLSKCTLTAVTGVRSYLVLFPRRKRHCPSWAHNIPGARETCRKTVTAAAPQVEPLICQGLKLGLEVYSSINLTTRSKAGQILIL